MEDSNGLQVSMGGKGDTDPTFWSGGCEKDSLCLEGCMGQVGSGWGRITRFQKGGRGSENRLKICGF